MNSLKVYVLGMTALVLSVSGCSSGPAKSEAEERKSFAGAPMPKDFQRGMAAQQAAAQKAAQEAASKAAANH